MRERIGRYRITGMLGEGGMGVVFAAEDPQLGRPVAIKTLRGASADPMARERLAREARTAAAVNHPAICQLYEIGEEDGELFLAMELLQGESLGARLQRGGLAVTECVSIALGMLAGIDALHRHGVVHRDLKPTNVFLTQHGVKLLDFGVATTMANAPGDTLTRLTTPGTMVGTPQYAAPEQLKSAAVDERTDVFSAGVVIYEMLAGRPPFVGATAVEVFHAIMYEEAPVLTGGASVAAIDRVLHRALAKRPADRYQSADAFAQDLRAALLLADTQPIAARTAMRLIVLPLRILRPDAETDFLAFSLADAITSSLTGLPSLVVRSSLAATRFADATPDLKALATEADVDVVLTGTMLRAGDQVRVSSQLLEAPAGTVLWSHSAQGPVGDLFALQDDLTQRIVDALALPLTAREKRQLRRDVPATAHAYERYLRGNDLSRDTRQWTSARDIYLECLEDDPHYAPAWAALGRMHRLIAKYQSPDSAGSMDLAESALKRALELNPELSAAENAYAHLEVDLGRAADAMVRLTHLAGVRSSDPEIFAGLTHASRYCGLLRASMAASEQARRLDPRIKTSVAQTCFMMGDYERVLELDQETIPYLRSVALAMLGRDGEALDALKRIERVASNVLLVFTSATEQLLDGRAAESVETLRTLLNMRDPEGRYYVARHYARAGEPELALGALDYSVDNGFFCVPAMIRDPWLDSLRTRPRFNDALRRAQTRHRDAVVAFLGAKGDQVLGVAQPV